MKEDAYNYEVLIDLKKRVTGVVKLEDDTIVVAQKNGGVSLAFPKDKFEEIFQEQMDDKEKKHIGLSFTRTELKAILRGLINLGFIESKFKWIHIGVCIGMGISLFFILLFNWIGVS